MTREGRDLLTEALALPLDERAKTAADLLESLHEAEAEVEEAWASEIQERVAATRAGELASTDWRTVLERVEREVLVVEASRAEILPEASKRFSPDCCSRTTRSGMRIPPAT
ncbi:MAG: addiction module protein [Thermoanaerobaculia bacterium]